MTTAIEELRAYPKPVLLAILAELQTWRDFARPEQLPPDTDWRTWYIRGGRGSGKTWTGGNVLAEMALQTPGDYGIVAPTDSAVRDVCIEGPSGVIHAFGTNIAEIKRGSSRHVLNYNQTMAQVRLRNGSVIYGDGADDGAPTIQGKNLRGLWADEVGLWRKWQQAWEESIRYAVRLSPARIVATGTPKRGHPLVRALMADDGVVKTLLRTSDNAANLDPRLLAELYEKYGGTTLGRQELEGEILDDVPGALWRRATIENLRTFITPTFVRVVVAIDPSATSTESADECGIVCAALGSDGHGYVLDDKSLRASPNRWASEGVALYHRRFADRLVAETNNGGEMVGQIIATLDPQVSYRAVTASRGKQTRAEPVAALYEQGKVHHVGPFELLEDQMCQWVPGEKSPDRMDALVWALTELMVSQSPWGGSVSGIA
jgi:phage terminase large subunit-like protein